MVDAGLNKKLDRLNEIGSSLLQGRFFYFIDGDCIYKTYEEIIMGELQLRTKAKYHGNAEVRNAYLLSLLRDTNQGRSYTEGNVSYLIGALNRVMKEQSYRLEVDSNSVASIFKKSGIVMSMLCRGTITSCFNCLVVDKNEWRIRRLGDRYGNSIGNTPKARGCK